MAAAPSTSPPLAPAFPNRSSYSLAPSQSPFICSPASNCFRAPALHLSRPRIAPIAGRGTVLCKATDVSLADNEPSSSSSSSDNWVPVVPLAALPRGERRVIIQDGETILLLWYKDQVFAIENRSPAEGAYSEGLINAKLTQDGCIVCPTTDSTFDLRSGAIKEWYPKNPVLRALTPALRKLFVYPVKTEEENIFINMKGTARSDASAEIVFSGKAQPGVTATDVNVDEVRMVVDEDLEGFGFTRKTELINGKAAVIGFLLLLDFELLTGKGLLKGTGFLDFLYSVSNALK
ncbi:Rieske domain-containing protein [Psidium guajava]|nr:Rieske domain-containing protein [Psidium guajava]